MKKTIVSLVLLLLASSIVAATRTIDEAQKVANRFLQTSAPARLKAVAPQSLQCKFTQLLPESDIPALFVFNVGDNGFVMVSAEDEVNDVVAYSFESSFPVEDLPANLQYYLQLYAKRLAAYHAHPQQMKRVEMNVYQPVEPLLTCLWGQDEPYNIKCPHDSYGTCVTGCVATAASQIMYFHKYPEKGEGTHSYEYDGMRVSADFGGTTYRWNAMRDDYMAEDYPSAAKTAVATLMFHAGVACDMQYTSYGSGAYSPDMLEGFYRYFRYDKSLRMIAVDYQSDDNCMQLISYELTNSRPIYIAGGTIAREGHAFVCDGMDENGKLHINWGWNGKANGYYMLRDLSPAEQGTGGSSMGYAFTEEIELGIGIRPDFGGEFAPTIVTDEMYVSDTQFGLNEPFTISTGYYLLNYGACVWDGQLSMVLYKDGQLFKVLESESNFLYPYESTYEGTSFTHSFAQDGLADGTYQLTLAATCGTEYYPIHVEAHGAMIYDLIVDGNQLTVTPSMEPTYIYDIVPQPEIPQALEQISDTPSIEVQKLIYDGHVYIIRADQYYDVLGHKVK
ncbi:MAG: C10 family peptidase [Paludibacteraceae bacterium]|nr:C10 family peptidase [Paludibacteraceae bacterium]